MEAFLRDHPDIRMVWTPDSQTRVNVSRYNSAAVSQLVINLRPARYLSESAAAGDQEEQSLQRQADELRQVRPYLWSIPLRPEWEHTVMLPAVHRPHQCHAGWFPEHIGTPCKRRPVPSMSTGANCPWSWSVCC